MDQINKPVSEWLTERMILALLSAVFAAITLFLYPLVLWFFAGSHGSGAGKAFTLFGTYYQFLFSKFGLSIILIFAAAGFLLGNDRMASVFSFFWGTHACWPNLEEKLNNWRDEHFSESRLLIVVMIVLIIILGMVLWGQSN